MSKETNKEYTPQEAAALVLEKVKELYKNSTLAKANTSHEIESGGEANNDDAEAPEHLQAGEVCKEGSFSDTEKKGSKKKKADGSSEESEDSEEPAHEEGMSEEENEEHDAIENEADEQDADQIEADEEPAAKEADEESEDEDESEDKKKKKPFEKSERPLAKFLAKMEYKKSCKVNKCGDMVAAKMKKSKKTKTKKIEKFLGLGGTQTSGQNPTSNISQGKPAAPAEGQSIADKINFGGKK